MDLQKYFPCEKEISAMDFQEFFPIWDKLTANQQERLSSAVTPYQAKKGTILHNGDIDCIGLLLIRS